MGLTQDQQDEMNRRLQAEIDAGPCGLWWILSTLTTAAFIGLAFGLLLWLVLA